MLAKKQILISNICIGIMILMFFYYGVMLFYLPVYLESLTATGEPLSPLLRSLIMLRDFTKVTDYIIVPLLIISFVFVLVWRIYSEIQYHKVNALTNVSH